jgi:hypothetical protein
MNSDAALPQQSPDAPQYARFVRRFRAIVIDFIVMLLVMFGSLFIASIVGVDHVARVLGVVVVLTLLLYEPSSYRPPAARSGTTWPICAWSMTAATAT